MRENIQKMLQEGEFECLLCDHIERDEGYLKDKDKGVFCRECGCSLYYWPHKETKTFDISTEYDHDKMKFVSTMREIKS